MDQTNQQARVKSSRNGHKSDLLIFDSIKINIVSRSNIARVFKRNIDCKKIELASVTIKKFEFLESLYTRRTLKILASEYSASPGEISRCSGMDTFLPIEASLVNFSSLSEKSDIDSIENDEAAIIF